MQRALAYALTLTLGCGADAGGGEPTPEDPELDGGSGGARPGGSGGGGAGGGAGVGGAPMGGSGGSTPPEVPVVPAPKVAISEIMYHPVLEEADVEGHEFVELHNPSMQAVALAGWKLAGDVTFTFPAGASIGPQQYVVIARSRKALSEVTKYGVRMETLLGDYQGELDNGSGRVILQDGAGDTVDAVAYRDELPWPVGADALGAQEGWLPAADLPLERHRHMGRSLERISFTVPASEIPNWAPSPLDGATPGKVNTTSGTPPGIVVAVSAAPMAGSGLIRAASPVVVRVRFAGGAVGDPQLEYFVDDVARTDEMRATAPLAAGTDGFLQAVLPARPDNSVVRYRIRGTRGAALEVISPRPSDPYQWHAYFVSPAITSKAPVYQVFVAPQSWGKMYTNVQPDANSGRVMGCKMGVLAVGAMPTGCPGMCMVNPTYNARVPAVFVHDGKVWDVQVRYQGSKVNRLNGRALPMWPFPGPTGGGPTRPPVLSWTIKFPRYASFGGKGTLILNKLVQACPGFPNSLGARISEMAGVPAPQVRWARFYVNGGYYNYAMELERPDEDMLRRFYGPRQPIGDLYKNDGLRWDEGPWGWGDGRLLEPYCGYTSKQRWQYNYPRKTLEYRPYDEIVALHEETHKARAAGPAALRAYLDKTFDVKSVITWVAINNYVGAWDDNFHNHYFYKRPADGKWLILPWDYDTTHVCDTATTCPRASQSLWAGREGDPGNRVMIWNLIKDSIFRIYKTEYDARVKELATTFFRADNVTRTIDAAAAPYDAAEAAAALSGVSCNATQILTDMKRFAPLRNAYVTQQLGM